MDDDAGYEIRLRAHELWAQGGRPNASSLAFWIAAEAELETARSQGVSEQVPSDHQARRVVPGPVR